MSNTIDHDIIVIGAGLSGIDAAYRIQTSLPGVSYTVLEARDRLGGTWSFFRFPGVRSDSALALFSLPWRPWTDDQSIADADTILDYLEDAAYSAGIDRHIRLGRRVRAAAWSSKTQRWTLEVEVVDFTVPDKRAKGKERARETRMETHRARFLFACCGYYDYEMPLQTHIPRLDKFRGVVAHPQFWPDDLDWTDARVVLVGSGATAVTLLPVLAEHAEHVTLLQRSPSYVLPVASVDRLGATVKRVLPARLAHAVNWWRAFVAENLFVLFCLTFPRLAALLVRAVMWLRLPVDKVDLRHFDPAYFPMEQRLCVCPDGDFFDALGRGNVDVVTDRIADVVEDGIVTRKGLKLDADIIVTATGLRVHLFGGVVPTVDGVRLHPARQLSWRGTMMTGLPNAGAVVGYTTYTWTLGADASIKQLVRVYARMTALGASSVVPRYLKPAGSRDTKPGHEGGSAGDRVERAITEPVIRHPATYFVDARGRLPRVIPGKSPWYGRKGPLYDWWQLWFGDGDKGLAFSYEGVGEEKAKEENAEGWKAEEEKVEGEKVEGERDEGGKVEGAQAERASGETAKEVNAEGDAAEEWKAEEEKAGDWMAEEWITEGRKAEEGKAEGGKIEWQKIMAADCRENKAKDRSGLKTD